MPTSTLDRHLIQPIPPRVGAPSLPRWVPVGWVAFVVAALLLLDRMELSTWGWVVPVVALGLSAMVVVRAPGWPWARLQVDWLDLGVIATLYVVVVGLFSLAFVGFTTDNVLGLFLSFAGGLVLGVGGPIAYTVWRRRPLRSLGLGLHNLRATLALAVLLAAVQFAMTLWGYALPTAEDWVPLLVMSVTVGLFEAVFFRGFVQGRLEAGFGVIAGAAGGALLYALYHVGYGMAVDELVFLFGLGVVYAVAYRLVGNVFVLWPLLTPLGGFFNNVEAGDIDLPWASIAGFAEVLAVMAVAWWLAARHQRRRGAHVS